VNRTVEYMRRRFDVHGIYPFCRHAPICRQNRQTTRTQTSNQPTKILTVVGTLLTCYLLPPAPECENPRGRRGLEAR
jgi:hypothetical protein